MGEVGAFLLPVSLAGGVEAAGFAIKTLPVGADDRGRAEKFEFLSDGF